MSADDVDFDEISTDGFRSRELAVAVLAGIATIGLTFQIASGLEAVAGAILAVIMLAVTVSDLRRLIIPDVLTATGGALGVLLIALQNRDDIVNLAIEAALRSAAMIAVFLALRAGYRGIRGREGVGLGDVKLAGVAGVWLQAASLPIAVEIAALSGLAFALICRWRAGTRHDPWVKLPFGAFFAPAIWLCWLFERW